ncbi:hypothetical protein ACK3TF_005550 [Chlorella vulgaris]
MVLCCRAAWGLLGRHAPAAVHARVQGTHRAVQVLATAHGGQHAFHSEPAVDPPPTVPLNPDAINSVVVSGMVYRFAANQVAAHVRLGLRSRAYRADMPQRSQGAVTVDAWGLLALQLSQHVRKGACIQVSGALREDTWTDKATGLVRRAVKLVAEDMALVAPGQLLDIQEAAEQVQQPSQEGPPDGQVQQAAVQAPKRAGMSQSAEQTLHMYQVMGLQLDAIAAARGIKTSTVLDHLITAAGEGAFSSWQRLGADLLGPPGSDTWLSPAEVAEALLAVEEENPGTDLDRLPLRAVRQQLDAGESTAPKVAALVSSRSGDPVLVYSAIKLVTTMLQRGVDLALLSKPPAAASEPPAASPAPPPSGAPPF